MPALGLPPFGFLRLAGPTLLKPLLLQVPQEFFIIVRALNLARLLLGAYLVAFPCARPEGLPEQNGGEDKVKLLNSVDWEVRYFIFLASASLTR